MLVEQEDAALVKAEAFPDSVAVLDSGIKR
jgi:hypothetical protein